MMSPTEKAEHRERALAILAERGLVLACDLQEAALATSDIDEKARLASVFAKVSRSVRQTFALDAKLDHDRLRMAQAAEAEAVRAVAATRADRTKQVKLAVERAIWNEYEADDAELVVCELEDRLEEAALEAGFDDTPVDILIARISAELGLAAQDSADAAEAPAVEPAVLRRSSA